MYFILSGTLPFKQGKMSDGDVIDAIKFKDISFENKVWKNISSGA